MDKNPVYRILIVDDSSVLRQVIRRYIESGYNGEHYPPGIQIEISEAGNGIEAETLLQESFFLEAPIDLLFLDWMMPRMTGISLLKKLRDTEIFKINPNVIMLTAETSSEQVNACIQYRVAQYLTKPFTAETVVEAVGKVMQNAV